MPVAAAPLSAAPQPAARNSEAAKQAAEDSVAVVAPPALLTNEDIAGFAKRLRDLAAEPIFSGAAVAHVVDVIHDRVGSALNRFMREQAALQAHLDALQAYVLLSRGDLARDLLDAASELLQSEPHEATADADLQRAFAAAATHSGADDDPLFAHVSISWQRQLPQPEYVTSKAPVIPAAVAAQPGAPSWNTVQLAYTPPWPLPLLLTRAKLSVYETLSTYLLAVERAQRALDDTWQHLMTQRRASRRGPPPRSWALHQRMAHFVRHVHAYLKDDVIKRCFEEMRGHVEASQTFEQVEAAHERLQDQLKALTFLAHTAVCEKLQAVLQQCTLLCSVVTGGVDVPLAAIDETFTANCTILKQSLRSQALQGQTKGIEVIKQLLLRLDFNNANAGSSM